eukprot:CAMPEP_0117462186 /NCGR_PEP_ID=MMETSP0784-20121206/2922_1 /TAXON_ID=39447 /ORGANISM="" /LENGTH=185 /DNA_ID=CAMNT_0005255939 /DNA_START=306 /DNA_END=861 /DNA_ORIENTATION=+
MAGKTRSIHNLALTGTALYSSSRISVIPSKPPVAALARAYKFIVPRRFKVCLVHRPLLINVLGVTWQYLCIRAWSREIGDNKAKPTTPVFELARHSVPRPLLPDEIVKAWLHAKLLPMQVPIPLVRLQAPPLLVVDHAAAGHKRPPPKTPRQGEWALPRFGDIKTHRIGFQLDRAYHEMGHLPLR